MTKTKPDVKYKAVVLDRVKMRASIYREVSELKGGGDERSRVVVACASLTSKYAMTNDQV